MKTLIFLISLVIAIMILYPLLNENTGNQCGSLERQIVHLASIREHGDATSILIGSLFTSLSNGTIAASLMKTRYPDIPSALTCNFFYWRLLFDRDETERALTKLGAAGAERALSGAKAARDPMGALASPAAPTAPSPQDHKPADQRELNRLMDNAH